MKTKTRKSRTAIYSKINNFKDIAIDDVLLEAENALKLAQTSLVDDNSDATEASKAPQRISDFKDINIDSVLLEAENALKVAENSIVDDEKGGAESELGKVFATTQDSVPFVDIEDKVSVDVTEIVSSTLGGILLGSILGSVCSFKLFDTGVLDFSANGAEFSIPIATGVFLGGVAGFTGSSQDSQLGVVVRSVLGAPTKALASAMVNSIQESARRQVEKTTNDIKSIPSNVADAAKRNMAQKASETKSAVDTAVDSAIETAKPYLLVATVVAVGFLYMNGRFVIG